MVWEEEGERFVLIRQHVDMLLDSERSTMEAVVVVDNASSSLRSAGAAAPPPFEAKVTNRPSPRERSYHGCISSFAGYYSYSSSWRSHHDRINNDDDDGDIVE